MNRLLSASFALLLILASCSSNNSKTTPSDSANISKKDTFNRKINGDVPQSAVDSNATAFARFISGMDYPLHFKLNQSENWKSYAAGNTKNWEILESRIGNKIKKWVGETHLELAQEPGTLFYPFAGGDFYYPDKFFPNQDTIIMIGLEPCGGIFDPNKENADTVTKYFKILQHSMFFPHQLGFFRTLSMRDDFNNHLLNGTIHTVLFYMSKAGYDLHYIRFFDLDEAGNPVNETEAKTNSTKRYKGYRIGYSRNGQGLVRELVYFSQDASDGGLKTQPGVLAYLNKRGPVVTYYKAASYLMHYERFSTVRNYATNHSKRLLQDDSGIPYKFLLDHGFEVSLYGNYTHTLSMFRDEFQPALKAAYEKSEKKPVPFLIGYTAPDGECNLQSAVKKK